MTTSTIASRRPGVVSAHSVDRFVFTVPELEEAKRFYSAFGLDVRQQGQRLDLYTHGHPHCWASIHEAAGPKQLQYISYGIFSDDLPAFKSRIQAQGLSSEAHPLAKGVERGDSVWLRDPDV